MASYGALIRKITTAEINRVQREGGYTRWAYFIDTDAGRAGVVYANDSTFAAYSVADEPDPKLREFGLEPISGLLLRPDQQRLVLETGGNTFRGIIFIDPLMVVEDDLRSGFSYEMTQEWQHYLASRQVRRPERPVTGQGPRVLLAVIIALIVIFTVIGLL